MIQGARLRQAREVLGLTQVALAEMVGMPQSVISRLEIDAYCVSSEDAQKIADALEVPYAFLARSPVELPEGSLGLFRSLSSKVKSTEYRAARRLAEIGVESMLKLAQGSQMPAQRLQVLKDLSPEAAGHMVRSMLRLSPDEPIKNLTLAMERSGVLVLRLSRISEHITGFGSWIDPIPHLSDVERPMVVTRRPMSAFRLRFTLAHELGHLGLGHQVFTGPKQPVERDANLFAQALLMPADPVSEDLSATHLNIERLAALKGKWGVSMHALAMRAKHLGIINEWGYWNIYENLRSLGFLKKEPGDDKTVPEQPRLLAELMLRRGLQGTIYDLAGHLDLGLLHAKALLGDSSSDLIDLAGSKAE